MVATTFPLKYNDGFNASEYVMSYVNEVPVPLATSVHVELSVLDCIFNEYDIGLLSQVPLVNVIVDPAENI